MTGPTVAVALRPMAADHLATIIALEVELFGPEAWTEGILRDELAQPESRHYVVAVEPAEGGPERIVGYAGLARFDHEALVTTIGVVPDRRRTGLGAFLLTDLLAAAGDRPVVLEVEIGNTAAQRLYQRHGFAVVGVRRGYYQATGADALVMSRPARTDGAGRG